MAEKYSHLLLFGDNFTRPVGNVAGSRVLLLPVLLKLLLLPQELRVLSCPCPALVAVSYTHLTLPTIYSV